MSSTAFAKDSGELRHRKQAPSAAANADAEARAKEQRISRAADGSLLKDWSTVESIVMPIFFTALAAFTRLWRIGDAKRVIWDEAHFGKFGSFYLKHEYYFDVHPPLGKMLCGLSGWLANYNGSFGFDSGLVYPEGMDYVTMREFNALFAIIVVPVAYFTAKALKFSLPTVWLVTTMVALELSFSLLGRLILLDSMLMCFTVLTFLSLVKFHNEQSRPFTFKWIFWLAMTGLNLGLTTSVKMVGVFIMAVVGVYTVADLWVRLSRKTNISNVKYILHWAVRVALLIVLPLLVFALCFKVHFALLYKTGDGLASMSSLFKANLEGSDFESGPMDLAYGSKVTLKNQGLSGGLLHSHHQTFPSGSKQQQVTTYSHVDANNEWVIDFPRWHEAYNHNQDVVSVHDGDLIRAVHFMTGRNLHSHEVSAPVTKGPWEVSCYGNDTVGDEKDNWIIEVVESLGDEDPDTIHPLTTSFRLRHAQLGCYLGVTGTQLPEWGFSQGEVVCISNPVRRNKNTWWNLDTHDNPRLPDAFNRNLPKSKFLRDFLQLNFAQMASNNALVPDPDKEDNLASSWWEWPILRRGLRLCGWGNDHARYYLMMLPTNAWLSTAAMGLFVAVTVVLLLAWQRQAIEVDPQALSDYLVQGGLPFLGWFMHFLPFIIMSRVTYFHHYMPALYFALFEFAFLLDRGSRYLPAVIRAFIYIALFAATVGLFVYFSPVVFGMTGEPSDFDYLQWLPMWNQGT